MPQSIVQYDKTLPYIEDRNPWEVPVSYLNKKIAKEEKKIDVMKIKAKDRHNND